MNAGIGGITLSTSLVTLFNAVVLGILILRKLKMDYAGLFKNLAKMCIAGVISFILCFSCANYLSAGILRICIVGIVCLTSYTALNLVFKTEYVTELKNRIIKK